ncbi:MAG: hypothetical protein QM598_00135 [Protaetiibacter sp.]
MNRIDDRLDRLREPRRPLGRLATAAITVGVIACALSVGVLAYGAVQVTADTNRSDRSTLDARAAAAPDTTEQPGTTPEPRPAPTLPPPPPPLEPGEEPTTVRLTDADIQWLTIHDDLSLIPFPADWSDAELADAKIGIEQERITGQCMEQQGYSYRFTFWWLRPARSIPPITPQYPIGSSANIALWGDPSNVGDSYRWQDAGCRGLAVHETGMDDAH